jgi:hypothetical protein
MHVRLTLAALTAFGVLISGSPLSAQAQFGRLTRAEKRLYHACLYADFIANYCRFHAWGYFPNSFRDCVVANGGCGCVTASGGYWGPDIDDSCGVLHLHVRSH